MSIHRHPKRSKAELYAEFIEVLRQVDRIVWHVALHFNHGNAREALDLRQDILADLWQSYPTFRRESSLTTWAYRIALRRANRNAWRSGPPTKRLDDTHLALADEDPDPLVERLYELIDYLSDNERSLTILYIDGLSEQQIADMLQISPNAVAQRIKRIKLKLKRLNHEKE